MRWEQALFSTAGGGSIVDSDFSILFVSQMHCTGEHGKTAAWLRENLGMDAQSLCTGPITYLNYHNDWGYDVSKRRLRAMLKDADAVILEEGLPSWFGLKDSELEGKIVVRDAHGTMTRRLWNEFKRSWSGPTIYRTPDLAALISGESLLVPCSIDFARYPYCASALGNEKFSIAHAPSNPTVKGSKLLAEALKELHTEALWSQGEPNAISLYRRRNSTVYFDNIADGRYHGYKGVLGVAGIEAAAMGQVVLGDFTAHRGYDALPDCGTTIEDVDELIEVLVYLRVNTAEREKLQSDWYSWARSARDRNKITREFVEWLKMQLPYSSV